ncbi:GGDEF domain-containing protein [Ramlibacter sp. PS4R-6]|uniref:GGDEF domain-containing protein n=1 Tax=Ramlibacter sp. PS4R-6 TaxID=3133438 RepID=UPI0030A13317
MIPAFEATAAFAPSLMPAEREQALPLASRWLRRLLRPQSAAAPDAMDRSTGLFNRAGLFAAAKDEQRRRGAGVPVSAIVLEFSDLPEVRDIYGAAIARKVVDRLVRRLRSVAGAQGLVGRTGPMQFTVVFVGAGEGKALKQLQRGLGQPARVEFDAGDSEIVLVPEFVVDEMEPGAPSLRGLYGDMARELARMQMDERRRLNYLTSERERHSRPMAIRH